MLAALSLTAARAEERGPTFAAQAAWTLHLLEQARYAEATDAAQAMVNQDPNAAPSYQARGALALLIGNAARAKRDFDMAATHAPGEPTTAYALAECALFAGRLDDAQKQWDALRQSPSLTEAQAVDVDTARAYVRFLRGDTAGASALLTGETATDDPMRAELAALLTRRTDRARGAALLTKFLETSSGVPRVTEDDGIRARFETTPAAVEASVTEPPLQRMFAARLADRMAAAERSGGPTKNVSGTVTLDGAATARGLRPALVTFSVDNRMVGMVNTSPFVCSWDSGEVTNGRHMVRIEATDAQGNVLGSQSRTLRVANRNAAGNGTGDLNDATRTQVQDRLWRILRLRPARKAAEWTLAEDAAQSGDRTRADAHRAVAAALDPDYKGGRAWARALFGGSGTTSAFWQGSPRRRQIALTFDDGPGLEKTPALLDALDKAHAPATFFVVGQRALTAPDVIRRMAARGDDVGNHTFSHPNLTQTVASVTEREILRTVVIIRALAGRRPRFFRPPGGNVNDTVEKVVRTYGLSTALWTVDALSAEEAASPQGLIRFVVQHARPGAIVLLHNGPEVTTKAIPGLVAALRAAGYQLVTLSQMTAGGTAKSLPLPRKIRE